MATWAEGRDGIGAEEGYDKGGDGWRGGIAREGGTRGDQEGSEGRSGDGGGCEKRRGVVRGVLQKGERRGRGRWQGVEGRQIDKLRTVEERD